ncbi:MAG: hypothetical protein AABM31_03695 [Actinomycetota bacterium]
MGRKRDSRRGLRALAAACLAACAVPAALHAQAPPPGPVNQAPPTITRSGGTLSTDGGSWVGAHDFTYNWLRCTGTAASSCGKPVTGAIEPTYQLSTADAGSYLRVRVTASNPSGSNSSLSEPFGPIESAPAPTLLRPFPVVVLTGRERGHITAITGFNVRGPRGALVAARCSGRGCAFRSARKRIPSAGRVRLRNAEGLYSAGNAIEVRVTAQGRVGKFTRIRIRRDRVPARTDLCLQPGARRPSRCPSD